jgi:hypothetical protein
MFLRYFLVFVGNLYRIQVVKLNDFTNLEKVTIEIGLCSSLWLIVKAIVGILSEEYQICFYITFNICLINLKIYDELQLFVDFLGCQSTT